MANVEEEEQQQFLEDLLDENESVQRKLEKAIEEVVGANYKKKRLLPSTIYLLERAEASVYKTNFKISFSRFVASESLELKCEVCRKMMKSKAGLTRHRKTMHPELFSSIYNDDIDCFQLEQLSV